MDDNSYPSMNIWTFLKCTGKFIGRGVLIAFVLIVAKAGFEHSYWGSKIETLTFEFLQNRLLKFSSEGRLEILVVDIHKLPPMKLEEPPDPLSPTEPVTQRAPLKTFIQELVKFRPTAIAIDVDFSLSRRGWITNEDPEFFYSCHKIRETTGVPIFLGVYRKREEPAKYWLGLGEYKDMAVDLWLPWRTGKVTRWVVSQNSHERLPTLSAAVAERYAEAARRPLPRPPRWLEVALQSREQEFLVNYSKLEQLQNERLPVTKSCCVADFDRDFFENKMIIIGNVQSATDKFNVPGRDHPIPGAYVQACAAHTLAIEPLYEFRESVRWCLDGWIAFLIIAGVACIRCRRAEGLPDPLSRKYQSVFVLVAIILVAAGGIFLVHWQGVMWLDFFLVIFVLPLHPQVEEWCTRLSGKSSPGNRTPDGGAKKNNIGFNRSE